MTIRFSVSAVARHVSPPSSSTHRSQQRRLGWLLAGGLTLAFGTAQADVAPSGSVVTADEHGASLTHIDLGSGTATRHAIGIAPHNVQLDAAGRYLMAVGEAVSDGHAHGEGHAHGDAPGKLKLFSPETPSATPLATIEVGSHPAHVVSDREGRFAFVTNAGDNSVSVVDLETRDRVATITTGEYPHGLRLSPDGQELYVANVLDGSVSVIDLASLTVSATHEVGAGAHGISVDDTGRFAFITSLHDDSLSVIDLEAGSVVSRHDTGQGPNGVTWITR